MTAAREEREKGKRSSDSTRHSCPSATRSSAGQTRDDDVEDGNDAVDDGVEHGSDGVDDGHEACSDGVADVAELFDVH